jgi:two-component system, OmpR family, response regulator
MMNSVQPRPASLAVRGAPPTGLDPNSAAADSFWDISHTYQAAFQVLLAGPDRTMMDALRRYLQAYEFRPRLASTTQEISKCLECGKPHLVVLDQSGCCNSDLAYLRFIRSQCDVPVIVLGNLLADEVTVSVALEFGADDWLARPFGYRELVARARAILRRFPDGGPTAQFDARGWARFGDWRLHPKFRRLLNPDSITVPLTKGEFATLMAFVESPRRLLTRGYLVQATRVHQDALDRSVDVQVMRLRQKIEVNPRAPTIIQTCRGIGYRLALPVEWD